MSTGAHNLRYIDAVDRTGLYTVLTLQLKFTVDLLVCFQSHLAKRRDHLRQNKMPQLSELAEKEGTDDKKEQEVPKVTRKHQSLGYCNQIFIGKSLKSFFLVAVRLRPLICDT